MSASTIFIIGGLIIINIKIYQLLIDFGLQLLGAIKNPKLNSLNSEQIDRITSRAVL